MAINYLWDTNTIVYFLQNEFPAKAEKFIDKILLEGFPIISTITEIELLCWQTITKKETDLLKDFIQDSTIIELETEIKLKTAEIRKYSKIKLSDAIIAATAIVYELTLITRNNSDFKKVKGLKYLDIHLL